MARNAQLRHQSRSSGSRQYGGDFRRGDYGSSELRDSKRESRSELGSSELNRRKQLGGRFVDTNGNFKLTMKQLLTFWIGSFVIMILAFYVGFITGKREGAIAVLDRAGEDMVRLELHTPIEPYPRVTELGDAAVQKDSGKAISPNVVVPNIPNQGVRGTPDTLIEAPKIDFTGSNALPNMLKEKSENAGSRLVEIGKEVSSSSSDLVNKLGKVSVPAVLPVGTNKSQSASEVQEVYPGKNVFGPPPTKTAEIVKPEVEVVDLPAVTEKTEDLTKKNIESNKDSAKTLLPVKGWYVQVAAAPSQEEAMKVFDKVKTKGLSSSLEPASIRDRSFYRVLVGPFPSQAAALTKRVELKQTLAIPGEPFIRQIQ